MWEQLASDEEKTQIFAKVDSSSNQPLLKRFGIMDVPAVLLFKDRKVLTSRSCGKAPELQLQRLQVCMSPII